MKFNFVSYETMTLDITRYSKSLRRFCIDYGNLITTDSDKTGTFECFFQSDDTISMSSIPIYLADEKLWLIWVQPISTTRQIWKSSVLVGLKQIDLVLQCSEILSINYEIG